MFGFQISYVDCLDRFYPGQSDVGDNGKFGKGHYAKMPIAKPEKLSDVPRQYSRYGLPESLVRKAIQGCPKPEAVLVTCVVTYWYPGLMALIRVIREMLPEVPVILGGIYATLCYDHAVEYSGADTVVSGSCTASLLEHLGQLTGHSSVCRFSPDQLDSYPYPAFDLQTHIPYIPILTGQGCPFRCVYCASAFLNPGFRRRSAEHVVEEIVHWHDKFGVVDFAFYDDALLIDAENHIVPILEGVITRELMVRFHTPNALHVRPLSGDVAMLLFRSGFKTIRLGLETAFFDDRQALDDKVGPGEFEQAVHYLRTAGFKGEAIGAYLLYGLPGQDPAKLEASIKTVKACKVRPILAQYSPIPGTALWSAAVEASRYDLRADPIFHNNSIFPCQQEPFSWEKIAYFKGLTKG
jgi:radical SAM superfamily enzyme YgiQ (UPF0313 family)